MTQYQICRLCCNTFERQSEQIINRDIIEMLQKLLIKVDLTVSENSVICKTCHNLLEEHYNFKRKCMHAENYVRPFAVENVKVNLNEILNLEEPDHDNNVCRLCLLVTENYVTLSITEKDQFQKWFPEINLNTTIVVVFCPACYEILQKHLIFVESCVELEEQLCYRLLLQNGLSMINTENDQKQVKNEVIVLEDELDNKCDTDLENRTHQELKQLSTEGYASKNSSKIYKCKECPFTTEIKHSFIRHISEHLDSLVEKIYKCMLCNVQTKERRELKRHIHHCHPEQIQKYMFTHHNRAPKTHQCNSCQYQTNVKEILNAHICSEHKKEENKGNKNPAKKLKKTEESVPPIEYKCNKCKNKFQTEALLQEHIELMYTEKGVFKCDECGFV